MTTFEKFFAALIISFAPGIIGSYATAPAIDGWYSTLILPFFNPPNWVFGPVWTILYFLIGVSLYLLWRGRKGKGKLNDYDARTFEIFIIQIILNGLWSLVFFRLQMPLLAFITILTIVVFVFTLILRLAKHYTTAAYLLVPYLYWLGFATVLNFSIVLLN